MFLRVALTLFCASYLMLQSRADSVRSAWISYNDSMRVFIFILAVALSVVSGAQNHPSSNRRDKGKGITRGANKPGDHSDNFAIIVSSSRSYHNYRHVSNSLTFYNTLRNEGHVPDSNIILMLADDIPCNSRNPLPCTILSEDSRTQDPMYPADIEVDYRGDDVSVASLMRVLTNRHLPGTPAHRKLSGLNAKSNVFLFLTGHGGDNFFKFQDVEEILSDEIGKVVQYMHEMGLYRHLLFVTDTCQAFTMSDGITSPNVLSIGSSLKDQNSYAHHSDNNVGASVIDRFSYTFAQFVFNNRAWHSRSLMEWIQTADYATLASTVGYSDHLSSSSKFGNTPMSDFFVRQTQPQQNSHLVMWQDLDYVLKSFLDTNKNSYLDKRKQAQSQRSHGRVGTSVIDVAQRLYERVKVNDAETKFSPHLNQEKPGAEETQLTLIIFLVVVMLAAFLFLGED
jgi:phosphatidylinositol glycan class K